MAGQRQERAVRTRELLLRGAAEVFDEVGYSGASINKILERAGTTAGAVYFHFKSKEGLARAVIREQAADLHFPESERGLQQLLDMTDYLAGQMKDNTLFRAGVRLTVEQGEAGLQDYSVYEWWIERFRLELEEAQARGQLYPDVDTAAFAFHLVSSFTGTQLMSQASTNRDNLRQLLAEMWRCLLPALAAPETVAGLTLPVEVTG